MAPSIALYSARKLNKGWGYGNRVHAAILRLGWHLAADVDYRLEGIHKGLQLPGSTTHLILKGELFQPDVLVKMKGTKVLWYPDQVTGIPDRQRWMRSCARFFDLVCISHLDELSFYQGLNLPGKLTFLPVGYCPIAHINTNPTSQREIDIGFAGSIDQRRQEYLEAFKRAGLPITVKAVFGKDLQDFYSHCKIVWNLGWGQGGIQTRFFEAMGAGACVLTNDVRLDTGSPFKPGEHLLSYSGPETAIEQARKLLADTGMREKIALSGSREVVKHSIDNRLRDMLALLEERK